ncbi:hypothetical protein F4604DRAFT_1676951 [Suillus subluteus]|nr:hypothetical protein F4604DRAFT_1676951 [Suillus subluteus]
MEYWQRLVNLSASNTDIGNTCKVKSTWCHTHKDYERSLKLVQLLECKLGIIAHWVPEDREWQRAGRLIGLVMARIFELVKMNRVGTGYKLRKHIVRALQMCSAAIRSTLNTYNDLASAVYHPQQILKWEDVVKYAFLADFKLL